MRVSVTVLLLAPTALSHVSLGHRARNFKLPGKQALKACFNRRMHRIVPHGNGAFSAGAFGVRQNLERCSRLMMKCCAFGAKHITTNDPGYDVARRLRNYEGLTDREFFRVADIFFVRIANLFPMLG